jgi:hypothetical protein
MKKLLDDRKLFKHPIMTYPYSVTRYGVKNGLKTYFYKYIYDNFDIVYEEKDISSLAFMLSRFFYHNIIKYPEVIVLKEICCSVAYRGLMVEYKTPYCQWFIAPRSRVKGRVRVLGGRHNLVYYNHHKEIDSNELSKSLGAVFIHGGDAFIVHQFSLAMKSIGIEYFTIHDAFFVDSNYTLLLKPILIKAYAALYKYDYLRKFILNNKLTEVEHTGVSKKDKELLTGNLLRFIKTSNNADYLKRSVRTANFVKFK